MNIFVVDDCPEKSARSLCDKHVVKMILESAQMMSTTHRVLDGEEYYDLSKNNRRIKDETVRPKRRNTLEGKFCKSSMHSMDYGDIGKLQVALVACTYIVP